MEKTIQLDQRELQAYAPVDQQRINALAQIGALSLDMENAKRMLEIANERQREWIRQTLAARGIERFNDARPVPGGILVSLPDDPPAHPPTGSSKANGAVIDATVAA